MLNSESVDLELALLEHVDAELDDFLVHAEFGRWQTADGRGASDQLTGRGRALSQNYGILKN